MCLSEPDEFFLTSLVFFATFLYAISSYVQHIVFVRNKHSHKSFLERKIPHINTSNKTINFRFDFGFEIGCFCGNIARVAGTLTTWDSIIDNQ